MSYLDLTIAIFLASIATAAQSQYVLQNSAKVAPLEVFQECDYCPEMVVLPMGNFMMGGPQGDSLSPFVWNDQTLERTTVDDPRLGASERPVHDVKIDQAIVIGKNEIKRAEWMNCVDDGGCGHIPRNTVFRNPQYYDEPRVTLGDEHPVIDVSYEDIFEYIDWLNAKIGVDAYRLPTEADWEYAARAGTQTRFAQGDLLSSRHASFDGLNNPKLIGDIPADLGTVGAPVPVNRLDAANAWGIRHMSGNVFEVTSSCWTERYEGWATSTTYRQQSLVDNCDRVARGGTYTGSMDRARVAARGAAPQQSRSLHKGFRLVREQSA